MNGNEKAAQLLLDAGAKINIRDNNDKTPLALASGTSHDVTRQLLLLPKREKVVQLLQTHGALE